MRESVYPAGRASAMMCWRGAGSWTFSWAFSHVGGEQVVREFVLGLELSPVTSPVLAEVLVFALGWPLERSEIFIVFVPIFLPLLPHFEVDPLHFGILVALDLQTAFLTPPMVMVAFYREGVSLPHVQLVPIFRGVMPLPSMILLATIILYTFPQIVVADRVLVAGDALWPLTGC